MEAQTTTSRGPLAAGVAGGVLGFTTAWLVLAHTDLGESWRLVWGGTWFGLWIGIVASLGYGVLGGRRTSGAALAAALAALLVLGGLFSHAVVESLGDDPFAETVLGALVLLVFWALPHALLLLVAPAVIAAVAMVAATRLARQIAS